MALICVLCKEIIEELVAFSVPQGFKRESACATGGQPTIRIEESAFNSNLEFISP